MATFLKDGPAVGAAEAADFLLVTVSISAGCSSLSCLVGDAIVAGLRSTASASPVFGCAGSAAVRSISLLVNVVGMPSSLGSNLSDQVG